MRMGRSYLSSSGCTHLYGAISRFGVSRIIWTGGAYRPLRHDRHLNDASSFHRGVLGAPDRIEGDARAALIALDLKPAETAVEALVDRCGRPSGATIALPADGPCPRPLLG